MGSTAVAFALVSTMCLPIAIAAGGPAFEPTRSLLHVTRRVPEWWLAAHTMQPVHQALEVRLTGGIDLEEQHRLEEGRELRGIEVDDQRHEPALAADLLDEADVDLLGHPWLG